MILLDTNVVSAVMAPTPHAAVREWLNRQESSLLFLSTITLAEIGFSLAILPDGRRKVILRERFEGFVAEAFDGRILAFDEPAAQCYGDIMAGRRQQGRPLGMADGQIASIARAHRFAIATRNIKDFEFCGLDLIDPFATTER